MLSRYRSHQSSESITSDKLTSLHQRRFLQVFKDCPDIRTLTPDLIKQVFHAVVVLCEIQLYHYMKAKQTPGNFDIPIAWKHYFSDLQALSTDMLMFSNARADIEKILTDLNNSLIFSKDSLITFLEQDAIQTIYNALVPIIIRSDYLRSASSGLFDMEHKTYDFSWVAPETTANPWFLAYRRFFISADKSQLFAAIQHDGQYPNVVVKLEVNALEPKKIMLYAKSEVLLQDKIRTLKALAKNSESNPFFPQKLNIKKALYHRPALDILICPQLTREMWYCVNITLLLPTMLRIMYASNVYRGNCFGTAIAALGCSIIPKHVRSIAKHEVFSNNTQKMEQGTLKSGDMIYTKPHGFVYLDSDLALEAIEVRAPWILTNTRNIFKELHKDFDSLNPTVEKIDYANIDFTTTSIEEMRKWGISVYRKIGPTPPLLDEPTLELLHRITEILVQQRRLHNLEPEDPTLKDLPEYQLLKELFAQLIDKTQGIPALIEDIEEIKSSLPPSIQKIATPRSLEDEEAEYKAWEARFEAFAAALFHKKTN